MGAISYQIKGLLDISKKTMLSLHDQLKPCFHLHILKAHFDHFSRRSSALLNNRCCDNRTYNYISTTKMEK